jgi:hypothetical protein
MSKGNHQFRVTGRYPFPVDMLRYDCCWPASSEDGHKIEQSIRRESEGAVTVTLYTGYPSAPTVARWKSFGWTVDPTSYY